MSEKIKPYIPSPAEIKKAEEHLSDKQKEEDAERETAFEAGYEKAKSKYNKKRRKNSRTAVLPKFVMNSRMKRRFFLPGETPYKRIMRLGGAGDLTCQATWLLTNVNEIKKFIKESISEDLRYQETLPQDSLLRVTPKLMVERIREVINGPNIKTPEKKALWEKALQRAIKELEEENEHFHKA